MKKICPPSRRKFFHFKAIACFVLVTFSTLQIAWAQGPVPAQTETLDQRLPETGIDSPPTSSPNPQVPFVETSTEFLKDDSPLLPLEEKEEGKESEKHPGITTGNLNDLIREDLKPLIRDPVVELKDPKDLIEKEPLAHPLIGPRLLDSPESLSTGGRVKVEPLVKIPEYEPVGEPLKDDSSSGKAVIALIVVKKENKPSPPQPGVLIHEPPTLLPPDVKPVPRSEPSISPPALNDPVPTNHPPVDPAILKPPSDSSERREVKWDNAPLVETPPFEKPVPATPDPPGSSWPGLGGVQIHLTVIKQEKHPGITTGNLKDVIPENVKPIQNPKIESQNWFEWKSPAFTLYEDSAPPFKKERSKKKNVFLKRSPKWGPKGWMT